MQGVERLEWDAYVGLVLPAQFFCKSETVPQKNKVYYFFKKRTLMEKLVKSE